MAVMSKFFPFSHTKIIEQNGSLKKIQVQPPKKVPFHAPKIIEQNGSQKK